MAMKKINKNIVVLLMLTVASLKSTPRAVNVFKDKSRLNTKDAVLENFKLYELEELYNRLMEEAETQPRQPSQKPQEPITIPEDYYRVIDAKSSESSQQIYDHYQQKLAKLNEREVKINNLFGKYTRDTSSLSREDFKVLGIYPTPDAQAIKKAFNNQLDLIDIDRYVIERAAQVILTH